MNRRTYLSAAVAAATAPLVAGCDGSGGDPESPAAGTTGTPPATTDPRRTASTDNGNNATSSADPVPFLDTPAGFVVERFVEGPALGGGSFRPGPEPGPRMLASRADTLYVTVPSQGRVVAVEGYAGAGGSVEPTTAVDGLDRPHGIAVLDEHLYLALAGSVVRFAFDGTGVDPASEAVLVDDVPRGEFHWTRSVAIHEDRLDLSAGACTSGRCSAGNESYLGAITEFDLDGSNRTTYATGLRNAVGIGWHDGTFLATDNGVDGLGPDLPPDEVNVVREGAHYGYPTCYGDNVPDPNHADGESACEDREPPAATLPPHCAPLGFDVYDGTGFPAEYRGDVYVALHGSWAREEPTGYEVVRIPYEEGALGTPRDFVTGWMPQGGTNEDARGRPVDVHVGADGATYVTDDLSGSVYRVRFEG